MPRPRKPTAREKIAQALDRLDLALTIALYVIALGMIIWRMAV